MAPQVKKLFNGRIFLSMWSKGNGIYYYNSIQFIISQVKRLVTPWILNCSRLPKYVLHLHLWRHLHMNFELQFYILMKMRGLRQSIMQWETSILVWDNMNWLHNLVGVLYLQLRWMFCHWIFLPHVAPSQNDTWSTISD